MSILLLYTYCAGGQRPKGNDGCGKTFGPERSRAATPPKTKLCRSWMLEFDDTSLLDIDNPVRPGAHDTISISSDGCDPRIQDPDQPLSWKMAIIHGPRSRQ